MERLTVRIDGYAHGKKGRDLDHLSKKYHRGEFECTALVERLCEYEDAEEAGLLIHLPSKTVCHIVDQCTGYGPMVMATRTIDLTIAEIMGIDKDGRYWSTREAAEKALEAMK